MRFKAHKRVVILEEFSVRGMLQFELKKLIKYESALKEEAKGDNKLGIESNIEVIESIPDDFLKEYGKAYLDLKINQYVIRKWGEIERFSNKSTFLF